MNRTPRGPALVLAAAAAAILFASLGPGCNTIAGIQNGELAADASADQSVAPEGGDGPSTTHEGGPATEGGSGGADGGNAGDAGDAGGGGADAGGTGDAASDGGCAGLVCGGACVPNDVHNCGACGHDCTALPHVSGSVSCSTSGSCSFPVSSCAPGWTHCTSNPDLGCETDIQTTANCGSCGNACSGNTPVCSGSGSSYACASGCPAATPSLCNGTCVDTTSNPSDCSTCGNVCTTQVTHAQPACVGSACTFACNSGYTACSGACVDTTSDDNDCNGCGNKCTGGAHCVSSQCQCTGGTRSCSGTCLPNDVNACGPSCTKCAAPTGGTVACDGTSCVPSCPGSAHDCGNACVANDANACGPSCTACTAPTHGTPTCNGTTCGFTCGAGYVACGNACCGALVGVTGTSGNAPATLTLPISWNELAGDVILVAVGYDGYYTEGFVNDSAGNTYSRLLYATGIWGTNQGGQLQVYAATNVSAQASNVITAQWGSTQTPNNAALYVAEYRNSVVDTFNQGSGNSTSPLAASITTGSPDETIVAFGWWRDGATSTAGTGFMQRSYLGQMSIEDATAAATGSISAGFTLSSTTPWMVGVVALKP